MQAIFAPDYVRVGGSVYYITWPRLIVWTCLIGIVTVLLSAHGLSFGGSYASDVRHTLKAGGLASGWSSRAGPPPRLAGSSQGNTRGLAQGALMPAFCKSRPSTFFGAEWLPIALGMNGVPGWASAERHCNWKDRTATRVPFQVCTFDTAVDTQISAYIHKEGQWSGWKKRLVSDMLPLLGRASGPGRHGWGSRLGAGESEGEYTVLEEDPHAEPTPEGQIGPVQQPPLLHLPAIEGRTVVVDIGANVGFYTLLAAARGYDVVALEASREACIRMAYSLHANGIRNGADGDPPDGAVRGQAGRVRPLQSDVRQASVWLYNNAAYDGYHRLQLHYVQDNVGASWVTYDGSSAPAGSGPAVDGSASVASVPLDDLFSSSGPGQGGSGRLGDQSGSGGVRGKRAAAGGKGGSGGRLPALDPSTVALVKISAEGTDSRVLAGMRHLLSTGRVPFIIFVYNTAHVEGQDCDPAAMLHSLMAAGYRLYASGVYFSRRKELDLFLAANKGRSMELVMVRDGVEFW